MSYKAYLRRNLWSALSFTHEKVSGGRRWKCEEDLVKDQGWGWVNGSRVRRMPAESTLERERCKGSPSSSLKALRSGRTLKQQDSEGSGPASQLLFSWSGPVGPFFKNIYPAGFTRHHIAPAGMATPIHYSTSFTAKLNTPKLTCIIFLPHKCSFVMGEKKKRKITGLEIVLGCLTAHTEAVECLSFGQSHSRAFLFS